MKKNKFTESSLQQFIVENGKKLNEKKVSEGDLAKHIIVCF